MESYANFLLKMLINFQNAKYVVVDLKLIQRNENGKPESSGGHRMENAEI